MIIIGAFIGRQFRHNNQEENLLITQSNHNKDNESNKDENVAMVAENTRNKMGIIIWSGMP